MDTTFGPDLRQVHDTLSSPLQAEIEAQAPAPSRTAARAPPTPVDPRSQALVDRLFAAIRRDTRVPADVLQLIMRLQPPALRLAQAGDEALADEAHPLWEFVNLLAYEAEMMPDSGDPERSQLLRLAQTTITQIADEPRQNTALYAWAVDKLATYLRQRLVRRCTAAASQIGALQKLEDRLVAGQAPPSTMNGTLDVPQLDTVPAELLPEDLAPEPAAATHRWLDDLQPGVWLRLFLQGRWVHAQVLWPGERREVWLLGDGASDETWAVRRRALAMLHEARLLKRRTRRSRVRPAARQVHEPAVSQAA